MGYAYYNYAQKFPDSAIVKSLIQANDASKLQIQQLGKEISDLKQQLQKQQRIGLNKFSTTSSFLDVAIGSVNNLQALILKESYRNKIASLNNPTSNELGFNLELEIHNALKPLLQKAKKTNNSKFGQVVGSLLETGKRSPVSLFPAGNVFTSIISMVGNLTVQERGIDQQDLDNFIKSIEKYFNQYERLYQSNLVFNSDMEKMKAKLNLLQDDIRVLLQDLIISLDKTIKRQQLKSMASEDLMLRYFDSKKIDAQLNKPGQKEEVQFPQDAIKSGKEIANGIQRIYNEYTAIYNSNFQEVKNIISNTKNVSASVDQVQLNKTLKELEKLYNESKNMDAENLRLKTLFDRLEAITQ
jgi:hypothetical protein